jgi:hypothetical protein
MCTFNIHSLIFGTTVVLFGLAWCVGVGSWFFSLIEAVGVLRLRDWAFRYGPVATVRETHRDCPIGLSMTCMAETPHVKYRVLERNQCLFRRKFFWLEVRWDTPLEMKGIISWKDGTITVRGRYFLGITIFFVAWLVGWTFGGLMFLIEGRLFGGLFAAAGWLFAWGMFALSRSLELKRFDKSTKEVETALGVSHI